MRRCGVPAFSSLARVLTSGLELPLEACALELAGCSGGVASLPMAALFQRGNSTTAIQPSYALGRKTPGSGSAASSRPLASKLENLARNGGRPPKPQVQAVRPLSRIAEAVKKTFYEYMTKEVSSREEAAASTLKAIKLVRSCLERTSGREPLPPGAQHWEYKLDLEVLELYMDFVDKYFGTGPSRHYPHHLDNVLPPVGPLQAISVDEARRQAAEGLEAIQMGLRELHAQRLEVTRNHWMTMFRLALQAQNGRAALAAFGHLEFPKQSIEYLTYGCRVVQTLARQTGGLAPAWGLLKSLLALKPRAGSTAAAELSTAASCYIDRVMQLGYGTNWVHNPDEALSRLSEAYVAMTQAQLHFQQRHAALWLTLAVQEKGSQEALLPFKALQEAEQQAAEQQQQQQPPASSELQGSGGSGVVGDVPDVVADGTSPPANMAGQDILTRRRAILHQVNDAAFLLLSKASRDGDLELTTQVFEYMAKHPPPSNMQPTDTKVETSSTGGSSSSSSSSTITAPTWPSTRMHLALIRCFAKHKRWGEVFDAMLALQRARPRNTAAVSPYDGLRGLVDMLRDEAEGRRAYQLLVDRKALEVQTGEQLVTSAMMNVLLRAKALSGDSDETGRFFEEFKLAGVAQDVDSYNAVLESCIVDKKVHVIESLLEYMQQQDVSPDCTSYNLLIQGYATTQDCKAMLLALTRCAAAGYILLPETVAAVTAAAEAVGGVTADLVLQRVRHLHNKPRSLQHRSKDEGDRGHSGSDAQ